MDKKFIGERITNLRMKKDISERELSLSLGKAHNYIYSISSGKILPMTATHKTVSTNKLK